jgi:hypothetical protein
MSKTASTEGGDKTLLVRLPSSLYWKVKMLALERSETLTEVVRGLLAGWTKRMTK